jgi:hypothetical protein
MNRKLACCRKAIYQLSRTKHSCQVKWQFVIGKLHRLCSSLVSCSPEAVLFCLLRLSALSLEKTSPLRYLWQRKAVEEERFSEEMASKLRR